MRSQYKRLGNFITRCDEFNSYMEIDEILGISNSKYFQKSHTNLVDIDLTTYRIVRSNQFAFNRATTRNGDKISIALREGGDCVVSPSYRVFQVKDENELNSEYLMMWFRRPEFDRYARFKSHGSAHEFFDWEQMCEVELPVPHIEKQREIVKEYHVIVDRMRLNDQFNQKLEEAAKAIYKQWFVDFEFPDENGEPYKSNGGKMVWDAGLKQEIPLGWHINQLDKLATQRSEGIQSNKKLDSVAYIGLEHMPKGSIVLNQWDIVEKIGSNKSGFNKGDILFGKLRPYFHKVGIAFVNGLSSTDIVVIVTNEDIFYGLLTMILSSNHFIAYTTAGSGGTKMPRTSWGYMSKYKILIPDRNLLEQFNNCFKALLQKMETNSFSSRALATLKDLILARMTKSELLETAQPT